jgi:hypothetical protein
MKKDKLFLLKPGFTDAKIPGQIFICEACTVVEGALALYPDLAQRIDIERVDFARPRQRVIEQIGAENQSLPVLILADDAPPGLENGSYQGRRFAEGKDAILRALTVRHGLPPVHP